MRAEKGGIRSPEEVNRPTANDEAALLSDVRFALRGLDPWPPKGSARPYEDYARKVVEHLRLCGWTITRSEPRRSHST